MTTESREIRPGRYRHYKGNFYEVLGVARHSETEEPFVVYRCLYGDHSLWIRPLAMFTESVTVEGHEVPRFAWCGEEDWGELSCQPSGHRATIDD